jgi:hypothetical protein
VVKPEGKSHMEDIGVDGSIILRCITRSGDVGAKTGSTLVKDRDIFGHL